MAPRTEPVEPPPGLPELGTPAEVAKYLHTTVDSLAQKRYLGNGPKFIKTGRRVLYRWSDVLAWLEKNTIQRTGDPHG
jgi:predicted DNA-binding transcriptional regulator AlpA